MDRTLLIIVITGFAAFLEVVDAQTPSPRDAMRLPVDQSTPAIPATRERDNQERRDVDRDRNDARIAIERDRCGDLPEADRPACVRKTTAEQDRVITGARRAPPAR